MAHVIDSMPHRLSAAVELLLSRIAAAVRPAAAAPLLPPAVPAVGRAGRSGHGRVSPGTSSVFGDRSRNSSGHGRVNSAVPDSPISWSLPGPRRAMSSVFGESGTAEETRP